MLRIEHDTMWRDTLHEMGLQTFLQHPESRAAADVGAERNVDARVEMALERENPAAERGVAACTMRDRRTGRGQPLEFGIGRQNAMGHDGSRTAQVVSLVHGQVVARPREK